MTPIDPAALATVMGGENAYGRCGPGQGWPFLGTIYTPECKAHDAAVRRGGGTVMAHVRALPLLPAAIGSWVKAKVRGG